MPNLVTCKCGQDIPADLDEVIRCPTCGKLVMGPKSQTFGELSYGPTQISGKAIAGICFGSIGCLVTVMLFMPAIRSAREAARRSQCVSNLKQIGLAIHNYHEANGCLPSAAITDKQGKPLLSWRVALLPYTENKELYERFHLDEPWDSPHNLALVNERPMLFACPSDKGLERGETGYQVVIGPHTPFPGDHPRVSFQDITDGISNTLLVVETRRVVPWTKPEDMTFDSPQPLHDAGSHHFYHNNGFDVLFADGSVRFVKGSITRNVLDALISREGKEAISSNDLTGSR